MSSIVECPLTLIDVIVCIIYCLFFVSIVLCFRLCMYAQSVTTHIIPNSRMFSIDSPIIYLTIHVLFTIVIVICYTLYLSIIATTVKLVTVKCIGRVNLRDSRQAVRDLNVYRSYECFAGPRFSWHYCTGRILPNVFASYTTFTACCKSQSLFPCKSHFYHDFVFVVYFCFHIVDLRVTCTGIIVAPFR